MCTVLGGNAKAAHALLCKYVDRKEMERRKLGIVTCALREKQYNLMRPEREARRELEERRGEAEGSKS